MNTIRGSILASLFSILLCSCSNNKAELDKAKAEAAAAKAEAGQARAEAELAALRAEKAASKAVEPNRAPSEVAQDAPIVVKDIGIALDKGNFTTDAIFTNRFSGGDLQDVEFTVAFTADGSPITGKYAAPLDLPKMSKATSIWKNGETLEIKGFATYDFTRVIISGTCTLNGKPAKILCEKKY